jgi:outer membrane protein assembly factor BamB
MPVDAARRISALWILPLLPWVLQAGDHAQFGRAWSRNMISAERGLPAQFDLASGSNVAWTARLGTESYGTPVVAGGRVYIGTNNGEPRDPQHAGDRGVLLCLDERSGALLWQLIVPKREEDPYFDWTNTGMSSTPTVEGDRVYIVDNRGVVLGLDAGGMANGNDGPFKAEDAYFSLRPTATNPSPARVMVGPKDADILWTMDLTREAGIWSHDAAHSSILIRGDHLYLNSGTGVDNTHRVIRTPDAPGLVVLDKRTGRWLARDVERMAPATFHCTWSSPALAEIGGREQIVFAGGDAVLYGFEPLAADAEPRPGAPPASLRRLWRVPFDPTAPTNQVGSYINNRREGPSTIYGMPVIQGSRLYVAGGGDWFWGKNESWLKCYDLAGTARGEAPVPVWSAPIGRRTMATPAVSDGLAYVTDSLRQLHCIDALTGRPVWTHELRGEIWASAFIADGRVYVGSRRGDFWAFAHGREKRVLATVEVGDPMAATAVAANGTLFVATMKNLFAIRRP